METKDNSTVDNLKSMIASLSARNEEQNIIIAEGLNKMKNMEDVYQEEINKLNEYIHTMELRKEDIDQRRENIVISRIGEVEESSRKNIDELEHILIREREKLSEREIEIDRKVAEVNGMLDRERNAHRRSQDTIDTQVQMEVEMRLLEATTILNIVSE